MAIILNGTTGITTPAETNTGDLYVDGNVGIGTSTPTTTLDIKSLGSGSVFTYPTIVSIQESTSSPDAYALAISNESAGPDYGLGIFCKGAGWKKNVVDSYGALELTTYDNAVNFQNYQGIKLGSEAADSMDFRVGGTNRLSINSTGNVGIGTSNPEKSLSITKADTSINPVQNGVHAYYDDGGYGTLMLNGDSTGGGEVKFSSVGTYGAKGRISYSNITNSMGFLTNGSFSYSLNITASGYVQTPQNPAFAASGAGTNVSTAAGNPLQFSVADLNRGSNFNTSTYRFTAPVAGVYYFSVTAYTNSAGASVVFRKNGTEIYGAGDPSPMLYLPTTATSTSISIVLELNTNDYVDTAIRTGGTTVNIYMGHSEFIGYLIG